MLLRQECFSLLRRLHLAGYIHNSVYQRNILMQNGPLTAPPFKRSQEHLRFRLIDFGRAERLEVAAKEATGEELGRLINDFYQRKWDDLGRARGELAMEDWVIEF